MLQVPLNDVNNNIPARTANVTKTAPSSASCHHVNTTKSAGRVRSHRSNELTLRVVTAFVSHDIAPLN